MKVEIIKGSVVQADVDAVVNAANDRLQAGGGVCGAIFSACGNHQALQDECNAIGCCRTGHAVMTNGYGLKAKNIIHAVGPIYSSDADAGKLMRTYYRALELADNKGLKSIAFCSISTGIYGYPLDKATEIAVGIIKSFSPKNLEQCYVYCYQDAEYDMFVNVLQKQTELQKASADYDRWGGRTPITVAPPERKD